MSLFNLFKTSMNQDPAKEDKVVLFEEELPKHPEGAVKVGFNYKQEQRMNAIYYSQVNKISLNLVPILSSLGMLSKDNLYKFCCMESLPLTEAIREAFLERGGNTYFFDEFRKDPEMRRKFVYCSRPPKFVWPYISIKKCDKKMNEWSGYDYYLYLDSEKLRPFYEIWISGHELEKYNQHRRLINELNEFFEGGTSEALVKKYFCGGLAFCGQIMFNQDCLCFGLPYADTMKQNR